MADKTPRQETRAHLERSTSEQKRRLIRRARLGAERRRRAWITDKRVGREGELGR